MSENQRRAHAVGGNAGQQQANGRRPAAPAAPRRRRAPARRPRRTAPPARSPGTPDDRHAIPAQMATTAPSDAPDEMPSVYGVGERVAQHRLKDAPGKRQRAAGEQAEDRARQPKVDQDRPIGFLSRQDPREAQRERSDQRQHNRGDEKRQRGNRDPRCARRSSFDSSIRHPRASARGRRHVQTREKSASQSDDRRASSTDMSARGPSASDDHDACRVRQREIHVVRDRDARGSAVALRAQHARSTAAADRYRDTSTARRAAVPAAAARGTRRGSTR